MLAYDQSDPFADLIPTNRRGITGPAPQPAPVSPDAAALLAEQLRAARMTNDVNEGVEVPGDESLQGPQYLASLPAADRDLVQAYSDGRAPMPSGRFLSSPRGQRIMAAVLHFDPTFDAANYQTRLQTRRAFAAGGRRRVVVTSLSTALRHASNLREAALALNNSDWLTYNRVVNALRHEMGYSGPNDFNFDANAVSDEIETALVNSGGTLAGRVGWRALLNSNSSPAQYDGAFKQIAHLLHDRIQEIGAEYNEGMGRSDDPLTLLDPDAQAAYYRIQGVEPPSPTAAQTASPAGQVDRTTQTVSGFQRENQELSTGDVQADPNRARVTEQIRRHLSNMMKRGVGDEAIRNYGMRVGISPDSVNEALNFRRTPQWQQWRRQRPHEAYPFRDETRNVPMGAVEGAAAGAAASGPGTAFINSGNAMIPLPLIAAATGGDAERTRLGLEAGRQAHPGYALAGTLAGAGVTYAGAGRAAGAAGEAWRESMPRLSALLRAPAETTALAPRSVAGDLAYGAVQGAGENNDPLSGALENVGGGMVGRGAIRTAGRIVSPSGITRHDPMSGQFFPERDSRALYDIGVRLSPGQRFGGVPNAIEQRAQDIPLVGDMIRGTRERARDQFQTGVFNDALGQVGWRLPANAPRGPGAHRVLQTAERRSYNSALRRMRFELDPESTADFVAFSGPSGPLSSLRDESARIFARDWQGIVTRRLRGGAISGNDYKNAMSELGARARQIRSNPTGDSELADALERGQNILENGARRHSTPEAVSALDAADATYARGVQIENAARRRGGELGEFSPTQYDASVQQGSTGIRNRDYLAGNALNSRFAEQGRNLVDTIPDSGSIQRLGQIAGVNALAGGAAYAEPTVGLPLLAATGAAYAPGIRNIMTGALAPRTSPILRNIGDVIREQARRGSLLGPMTSYGIQRDYNQ